MAIIKVKSKLNKHNDDNKENKINYEEIKSEHISVFKDNKNTKKAVVTSSKTNFFNKDNNTLEKIDNTLVENDDKFVNKKGKHKVEIYKPNVNKKVKFSFNDNLITWEYLNKKGKSNTDEKINISLNEARYLDIDESVDISYVLEGEDLKENIIVKDKREEYKFSFKLKIEGLTLNLSADNKQIELKKNDSVEAIIPAPYMYDESGETCSNVYYELEELDEDEYIFDVIADESWINSNDRMFPVVIDPRIVTSWENSITYNVYDIVNNTHTAKNTNDILASKTAGKETKTYFFINKNNIPEIDGIIKQVKLILKPKNNFTAILTDDIKRVLYDSSIGDFKLDITERFLSNSGVFSFWLSSVSTATASFYGTTYPPYLEIEYLSEENDTFCKKTFSLANSASAVVDLFTGDSTTTFTDVNAEDSLMGMGV